MRISQNSLLSAAQMNAKWGMGVETPIRTFSLEDLLRGSSLEFLRFVKQKRADDPGPLLINSSRSFAFLLAEFFISRGDDRFRDMCRYDLIMTEGHGEQPSPSCH